MQATISSLKAVNAATIEIVRGKYGCLSKKRSNQGFFRFILLLSGVCRHRIDFVYCNLLLYVFIIIQEIQIVNILS